MTRLVRVHLGTSPGSGNLAFDRSAAFKRQLRAVLATPAGASLLTVSDHATMWVEAVCDAHTPGAEAWSMRAAELAPDIWTTLAERRKERVR